MKPISRLALPALALATLTGCSAGQEPGSSPAGSLTPGQEASAKTLGIATPDSVRKDSGSYATQTNSAQAEVDAQQKRVEAENAAVKELSGKLH
ncbi:hypothetical protein [Fimbriimonas ginsengisoli]|uniref:Lipoprotein n=1 Tax=Fimbriimonas ginsengisoli Gsoil 348 TaxID=661478 RepID=A0A068NT36_FIMGI|nr:hypothetical protein [Fimbriimonas ginsengisoli]AIE85935.1 hypothetical protein OP10G_2567 [Fimbriimonas ginsengisoli Gsoil 348]